MMLRKEVKQSRVEIIANQTTDKQEKQLKMENLLNFSLQFQNKGIVETEIDMIGITFQKALQN